MKKKHVQLNNGVKDENDAFENNGVRDDFNTRKMQYI